MFKQVAIRSILSGYELIYWFCSFRLKKKMDELVLKKTCLGLNVVVDASDVKSSRRSCVRCGSE